MEDKRQGMHELGGKREYCAHVMWDLWRYLKVYEPHYSILYFFAILLKRMNLLIESRE